LIVYAGIDGNIYTIDRVGENQTAITDDASLSFTAGDTGRIYQYPTWAPDGDHLAFIELSGSGQSDLRARLLNVSIGSGETVETFSSDVYLPFYLYWSPDSRNISFLSNGTGEGGLVLHLAAADGSGSHIAGTGQPYYWDWSPEEDEIFIHTGGAAAENPEARLAFMSMDDPFPSQEIDLQPASFQAPAWSPDGETIAMAVETETGEALVLQERLSGKQRTIAEIDGAVAFAWSPDGSQLAYTASPPAGSDTANKELYVVQPSRTEEKRLLASGLIVGFFWSPDGQHLAVLKPALPGQGDNSLIAFQQPSRINLALQVVDVETGKVRQLITFAPSDSFLNLLPFYDQYQRSMTLWSPDSREMVVAALDDQDEPGIYVIDALEGGSKRIADGDLAFWSWK
jgi:Tol biopolymer transport system component